MIGLGMALLVGVTTPAEADTRHFRFGHEVYFDKTDDQLPTPNGDDYFKNNGTFRARGVMVELVRVSDNAVLDIGHTDEQGEIAFDVPLLELVKFRMYGAHDVQGRSIQVYQDEALPILVRADGPAFLGTQIPGPPAVHDVVFDAAAPNQQWINVAAIASWVIHHRPAAFPTYADNGAVYKFAMDPPSDPDLAGEYSTVSQVVRIDPTTQTNGWRYKTVIAHELGHALQHWANYPGVGSVASYHADVDYGVADASCPSDTDDHRLVSAEYQSAALVEGMAHWVAAVAFNDTTEADCKYVPHGSILWHREAPSTHPGPYSCEGSVDGDAGVEAAFGVLGEDYFRETHSFGTNQVTCTDTAPTDTTVAVELDWERTLWDLITKENVNFPQIIDSFVAASPHTWTQPKVAFRTALATELGSSDPWDDQAIRNGVDQ